MRSERRRFDRVKASFEITYRVAGTLTETWRAVTIIDLSAGGLSFDSQELFEEREPIEVQIRLPGARSTLLLRALVVRSDMMASGLYRCALEFAELTPDQQAGIDELVQFLRPPPS